jgi:hypothetical protein
MAEKYIQRDFVIKDLVISVGGGGRGGTWLPADTEETPPSPISPFASVSANTLVFEYVRVAVQDAIKAKDFDSIGRAFLAGDQGGNPAIRAAIQEIGAAVVASAAYSALGGRGGETGLVDPDKTFETIPTSITPVVHAGFAVHRVTDLPRLKSQLAAALAFVDKASAAQAPRGAEVAGVRAQLEGALKNLPRG